LLDYKSKEMVRGRKNIRKIRDLFYATSGFSIGSGAGDLAQAPYWIASVQLPPPSSSWGS
jgi:hypothetical protein